MIAVPLGQAHRCDPRLIGFGVRGLAALCAVTTENPWFAVTSSVAHGGQVEYARAQAVADRAAAMGPRAMLDPARAREAAAGAQMGGETLAPRLREAARCFTRSCGDEPLFAKRCTTEPRRRDVLTRCLTRRRTGIGPKAGALMREYLGDDDAVAVDRHVANFACEQLGVLCRVKIRPADLAPAGRKRADSPKQPDLPGTVTLVREGGRVTGVAYATRDGRTVTAPTRPWKKGDPIGPREFAAGEKAIREAARACGVKPAELQVAAWLKGTCQYRVGRGRAISLELTKGERVSCNDVLGQHSIFPDAPYCPRPGVAGVGVGRRAPPGGTGRCRVRLRRVGPVNRGEYVTE